MNNEKEKEETEEVANMDADDWHFLLLEMEHH